MANQDVRINIKAVDKTKAGFSGVSKGLKKVTGAVFSMKNAIVGAVGAAGFGALIKASINAGDELAKTADKLGVTTEALAGLRHAAELTGVSTGTMDMALQRFTRRAAEAAQGTGEAKGALQELGINADELVRLPLDQQMNVVADSMAGVKSQSDRVRLAMKLFDSEGVALVNTLGGGAEALQKMTEEAEHLGVTLSRTDTAQMEAANDSITRLKAVFTGLTNQLSVAFAPIITFVADGFRQSAIDAAEFGNTGQKVANATVRAFGFLRNVVHGLVLIGKILLRTYFDFALFLNSSLAPGINAIVKTYNVAARVLGKPLITHDAFDAVANLEQSIAGLDEEIEVLRNQNPGSDLEQSMTRFILANRQAAESVAELKNGIAKLVPVGTSGFDQIGKSVTDFLAKMPTLKENLDDITKTTFKNMSDGLMGIVKGTTSVADAFKQMTAQLIMEAIRLFVVDKITGGFLSFAKGLGGGTSEVSDSVPGRAIGGSVQAGSPYMVGERGPEMFIPNSSGSIVPNDKMGGGITVVNNIDAKGAGPEVDMKIRAAMQQTSQQTILSIQDLMRRRRFV